MIRFLVVFFLVFSCTQVFADSDSDIELLATIEIGLLEKGIELLESRVQQLNNGESLYEQGIQSFALISTHMSVFDKHKVSMPEYFRLKREHEDVYENWLLGGNGLAESVIELRVKAVQVKQELVGISKNKSSKGLK